MKWNFGDWFREFSISFFGVGVKFGPPPVAQSADSFGKMLQADAANLTMDEFWVLYHLDKGNDTQKSRYFINLVSRLNMESEPEQVQTQLLSLRQRGMITSQKSKTGELWTISSYGLQIKEEYSHQQVS